MPNQTPPSQNLPSLAPPTEIIDTGTDDILAWKTDGVGVISLNRPERCNALSPAMFENMPALLARLDADPEVRIVMITGEGGAFCSGGDVKAMNERANEGNSPSESAPDRVGFLRNAQNGFSLAIHELSKPVVAAVDGAAAGAGLSIALAADLRLGSGRTLLVPAFVDVGASGDFGGSWFLTQLVGPAKAKELYFWSPRLGPAEARSLGLINEELGTEGFREAAIDYCSRLAGRAPVAVRSMKANINRAVGCPLREALDAEASAMIAAMGTEDHREAVAAFVEKRIPRFNGK